MDQSSDQIEALVEEHRRLAAFLDKGDQIIRLPVSVHIAFAERQTIQSRHILGESAVKIFVLDDDVAWRRFGTNLVH